MRETRLFLSQLVDRLGTAVLRLVVALFTPVREGTVAPAPDVRGRRVRQRRETRLSLGQLVDHLGTAVLLLVVALIILWIGYYMWSAGIDHTLHTYSRISTYDPETRGYSNVPLRIGLELMAVPLAAIAAARLRRGAETIAAPRASRVGPLLPLLAAAVLFGVFSYIAWWSENPQDLFGIHPQFGVQRWIGVTLLTGVGYIGMILFPRMTATLAGAVAGPALFAAVGYTLFPSFMGAASNLNTITDAEAHLADMLVVIFNLGAIAVIIGAILTMFLSERMRQRPLGYAVWMGALMLCLAVSGTFNGSYPGR